MKYFFILLMAFSNFSFAQQRQNIQNLWHLTVADSITGKGIPKVTISINEVKYFNTDSNGVVDIDKNLIEPKETIRISCIGYKPVLWRAQGNYKLPDSIRLSTSITSLKEVQINSLKPVLIKIDVIKKPYIFHRTTKPNDAYAQFIPNDKKIKGIITSVEYGLNDELHGIQNPFRVRLYTKNKTSVTLDKELTTDSIIVYNPEKKHRLSVDISKYNIQFPPDGVIAVFETLSASYYGKDSVLYGGERRAKTPGIDMNVQKGKPFRADYDKVDRKGPYSMVGPESDRWNWNGNEDQWFIYTDDANFVIEIAIDQQE